MNYVLSKQRHGHRIFWYKNPSELEILFHDYRLFVSRTGNRPPLYKVEQNIIAITERILQRENVMVSRIQATYAQDLLSQIYYRLYDSRYK